MPAPESEDRPAEVPSVGAVVKDAALGHCPRCGAKTMFEGPVKFADRCDACGLDYSTFNVGDGPAAFLTLAIGTVLAVLAIVFDQMVHPPFWLHVLIWVPLTTAMVIYGLRVSKGSLLAVEYYRDAHEARSGSEAAGHDDTDGNRP